MAEKDVRIKISLVDKELKAALKDVQRSNENTKKSVSSLNLDLKKTGDTLSSIRKKASIAFAGITGGILAFGNAFGKFEKTLTNVFTLLDDDTLKKYSKELENASKTAIRDFGFSIEDTNKALFNAVSSGVSAGKANQFLQETAKLAIGGVTSLSAAVKGTTAVMNAYGVGTEETQKITSAFFTAQKFGSTDVELLTSSIGKVAPIAKQAGIGYQELLAATAQLTLGGISTEESTTALASAIAGLIKPSEQARKVLEEFQVPIGATNIQSAGFTETLRALAVAADKDSDALAEMIPNINALKAIASLGNKELDNMDKILKEINIDFGEGSSSSKAFEKNIETFSGSMAQFRGTLTVASIELGEALVPAILNVKNVIQSAVTWFSSLDKEAKQATATFILTAAGVSGILAVFGLFAGQILNLIVILPKLRIALGAIGLFFAANPIGAAIGVIAVSVAALSAAIKTDLFGIGAAFDKFTEFLSKPLNIASWFQGQAEEIKNTNKSIVDNNAATYGQIRVDLGEHGTLLEQENMSIQDKLLNVLKNTGVASEKETKASVDKQLTQFSLLSSGIEENKEKITATFASQFEEYNRILQANGDATTKFKDDEIKKFQELNAAIESGFKFSQNPFSSLSEFLSQEVNKAGSLLSQLRASLSDSLGPFGGFLGGAVSGGVTSLLVGGLTSVFAPFFGGFTKNIKTVGEFAEESFSKLVRNTNKKLEDIGRERTTLEKQIDILQELKDSIGLTGAINSDFAGILGVSAGTTVGNATSEILQRIESSNKAASDALSAELQRLRDVSGTQELLKAQVNNNSSIEQSRDLVNQLVSVARVISSVGLQKVEVALDTKVPDSIIAISDEISRLGLDVGQTTSSLRDAISNQSTILDRTLVGPFGGTAGIETTGGAFASLGEIFGELNIGAGEEARRRFEGELIGTQQQIAALLLQTSNTSDFTLDSALDALKIQERIRDLQQELNQSIPSFDVGSFNVPKDTLAQVHEGEMIIPESLAQGIRSGSFNMSSPSSGKQMTVTVTNDNKININGTDRTGEEIFNQIRPFLAAQNVKNELGEFTEIFQ